MRILIAEDDSSLRRALISILQKNNYMAEAVDNGGDALDYLLSGLYDAAILDIMMPIMDGVSVLVNARKANNTTPILLLTAKAEIEDKIIGLDAGANDYLTKPFDMRELLARLRVLTRKKDIQQTSILSFGNTVLNTETFELSAPGGSYKLANKEYQTMLLFMRNPNVVISSSRVLENIWNPDSKAEDNTVWTYISYLRRKLEAIKADIEIHTMRGAGYTLEIRK
ncbi:response regulator transcription factor [uncultured Holdemanella sp.]|uniref:response regulator transcription factor n=1 Tax=uncultured Holdemanella sp. TaxID=1763549 RepID=UPI0025F50BEF|nr:response regulator transcription factor [uncultured Holdemanella sp.]